MKKYFSFLIVFVCIFYILNFCNVKVMAAVNNDYEKIDVLTKDEIDSQDEETNLDKLLSGIASTVFEAILKFIYTVARLVENLLTKFSTWLFGVNKFPWEDLIVFNSLPYLDINFFNAAPGSIFVTADGGTLLGDSIKSVYFSLLFLATSILGIGVAITAIRLAISTIAAEKAKYKEAITKCLYTVVMLFSVHIMISFVFYLNESICVTASKILQKTVSAEEVDKLKDVDETQFNDFSTANVNSGIAKLKADSDAGILKFVTNLTDWNANDCIIISRNVKLLNKKIKDLKGKYKDNYTRVGAYLSSQGTYRDSRFNHNQDNVNRKGYYDVDSIWARAWDIITFKATLGGKLGLKEHNGSLYHFATEKGNPIGKESWNTLDSPTDPQAAFGILLRDIELICQSKNMEALEAAYKGDTDKEYFQVIKKAYSYYIKEDFGSSNIISNLGDFFKNKAAEITDKDWNAEIATATFLYAILLVQSLMILINYVKRMFYVTLLAILAPIVVIYDFFMSAI